MKRVVSIVEDEKDINNLVAQYLQIGRAHV